jgi:hypothetical protein
VEHRGQQLNQSRIFFLLAATSLKFLAAHRLLFVAMFRLFCGSGAIARDAETNNDRGEHCMSDFVFPSSLWFSQLTPKLSRGLAIAKRRQDRRLERLVGHGYSSNS